MKNERRLLQLLRDNARAETPPPVRLDTSGAEPAIYIYDVIDAWWGVSAAAVIEALAPLGDATVHAHINSPGGDVFEGRAISAALVAYPGKVVCHIDGVAASAASTIALAGSEVRITRGGLFMIHESWTLGFGNKRELTKTASLLAQIDGQIAADYARRTGASLDQVNAWMEAETWFTEDEALQHGFVDAIDANTKREADAQASASRWNLSAYANAPKPREPALPTREQLDAATHQQLQMNRNRMRLLSPA